MIPVKDILGKHVIIFEDNGFWALWQRKFRAIAPRQAWYRCRGSAGPESIEKKCRPCIAKINIFQPKAALLTGARAEI